MSVYFPKKTHNGYYDKALQRTFYSKSEKATYMKSHNLVEDGSMESERHRTNRLVDQINYEREKSGLRPKTREELVGDSRR